MAKFHTTHQVEIKLWMIYEKIIIFFTFYNYEICGLQVVC